jgi:predicted lipid carrier protein YhbT
MSIMFLPLRLIPQAVQAVVLSTVLDLFFSRDTSLGPLLEGLDGRVFRIQVRDTGAVFFMGFASGHPWVHTAHKEDPDVRIEATTAGFARLCFAHEDADELVFQQVLKLSGDTESMLRFKKLLAAADIDYERELRSAFGEYFGTRVAEAAKALLAAEDKLRRRTQQTVAGALHDMQMPDEARLQAWQAGTEELTRHVTKAKGRLTRIEHELDRHAKGRAAHKTPPKGKA